MKLKIYIDKGITPDAAKTGWISKEDDHARRHAAIRPCVDAFLQYEMNEKTGILLAFRDGIPPAGNTLWVPGGEWKRGFMDSAEALKSKIKDETNLDIAGIEYMGMVSILWKESPYNTKEFAAERFKRKFGEGIHDVGHVFFAKAAGKLILKTMAPPIIIVTKDNYDEIMSKYNAHDYIRTFVKEALSRVR